MGGVDDPKLILWKLPKCTLKSHQETTLDVPLLGSGKFQYSHGDGLVTLYSSCWTLHLHPQIDFRVSRSKQFPIDSSDGREKSDIPQEEHRGIQRHREPRPPYDPHILRT